LPPFQDAQQNPLLLPVLPGLWIATLDCHDGSWPTLHQGPCFVAFLILPGMELNHLDNKLPGT
jgi:hypothetical protein